MIEEPGRLEILVRVLVIDKESPNGDSGSQSSQIVV